jgi:hypothetical protein
VFEHFRKYPRDIVYFPGYLLFGHIHAFIKIYALLTCMNASWTTAEKVNGSLGRGELEVVKTGDEKLKESTKRMSLEVPKRPALFVRRSRYHSQAPGVGGWLG